MSADGGQTWQPVGTGLSNAIVTALVKDAGGATLHAGVYGGGVANLSFEVPDRPGISPPKAATGRRGRSLRADIRSAGASRPAPGSC